MPAPRHEYRVIAEDQINANLRRAYRAGVLHGVFAVLIVGAVLYNVLTLGVAHAAAALLIAGTFAAFVVAAWPVNR